jgi:hypothetical protein
VWSTKDRLQFAVRFASLDLNRLREGDWLNLRDDFREFLAGPKLQHMPTSADYSEAAVHALQGDMLTLLRQLAGPPTEVPRGRDGAIRFDAPLDVRFALNVMWLGENNQGRKSLLVVAGSFRDRVLWTLSHLIGDAPTDVIRACPACGTLFARVRRQQYCSARCVKRLAMQHWRQTTAGKTYERQRSRQRYAIQTKTRTSPQVKVKSQPRSRPPSAEA